MEHKGTKTIETHRLLLRKFCAEDINAAYMNWTSDDRVTEFLRWPTHTSKKITETVIKGWIKESEKPEFYQWAIVLKDINEPIGTISVVDKNDDLNILHIGYCIGIIVTLLIMVLFNHAQPALLYLVPGVLITSTGTSIINGEFKVLWNFNEEKVQKEEFKKKDDNKEEKKD